MDWILRRLTQIVRCRCSNDTCSNDDCRHDRKDSDGGLRQKCVNVTMRRKENMILHSMEYEYEYPAVLPNAR